MPSVNRSSSVTSCGFCNRVLPKIAFRSGTPPTSKTASLFTSTGRSVSVHNGLMTTATAAFVPGLLPTPPTSMNSAPASDLTRSIPSLNLAPICPPASALISKRAIAGGKSGSPLKVGLGLVTARLTLSPPSLLGMCVDIAALLVANGHARKCRACSMNILCLLVGKPLATSEERAEEVGPLQGIPIFGLDALSSAAYGPEAALTLLIPLGLLGLNYIVPVSAAIIGLLIIVYFSYRQTIAAYPGGGGSYTVARFNLGARPSLLAAAALLTDYILTAAVGISAGVGALVSAVPALQPHTVALCVGILTVITILNLRGVRDAGVAFMVPTYLFVGTLLITIAGGMVRVALSGGHPLAVTPPPPPPPMTEAVTGWLLLKVFASGCTALTGVEAVSNGVKAFREPAVKNAQRTLTVIIFLLGLLLAGISYLVTVYGIAANAPGRPGYQSLLSMLIAAVFRKGVFYSLP